MKVLYIDCSGPLGGASRSLFEVVRALPTSSVDVHFLAVNGTVVPLYSQLATDMIVSPGMTKFDNTWYSHYRGWRWLVLLRELAYLPFTLLAVLRARRRWGSFDLIHANEITEIIPLVIAKLVFKVPAVVHVRSLQRNSSSFRCRWIARLLRRHVDAVIAIDEGVRARLPQDVRVDVIHNSFTPDKEPRADPAFATKLASLRPGSLKVGFVGNLHHSKGLFDLFDAAKITGRSGRDVEYLIVGGATRNDRGLQARALRQLGITQEVDADLHAMVEREGLQQTFHLLGATSDIQRVYEKLDVLCFPSHLDAPGRPVFEAAFSSVPSIVAMDNPLPDTLIDGETGVAIPMRRPDKLAEAILRFADHRDERVRMGKNARALAERNFVPASNARKLLALYARVVDAVRAEFAGEKSRI